MNKRFFLITLLLVGFTNVQAAPPVDDEDWWDDRQDDWYYQHHDEDGDSIMDYWDNCKYTSNETQEDADGDQVGDACDAYPQCAGSVVGNGHLRSISVATGINIETWATVKCDGTISVRSNISNHDSVFGDTARVTIAVLDGNGDVLTYSGSHTRGINACWFDCPNRSTLTWNEGIGLFSAHNAAGVAIFHDTIDTNRFWSFIWDNFEEIVAVGGTIISWF